jgi:23S rRNA (cytosine1962-C5)-methyltransferase
VARVEGSPAPGDEVVVATHEGTFIARGLYNPASTITVRLYRWEDAPLDADFWSDRISSALRLRSEILNLDADHTAYRLVFSEADGLSGLSVDRFDHWLVAHFSSLALYLRRGLLLELLMKLSGVQGIIARPDRGTAAQEGLDRQDVQILGVLPSEPVLIRESGLSYEVDLGSGQKTGFYCDQRENRRAVARYCGNRHVLDLFCYTGGFSLCALKYGPAASTLGIDNSAPAVDQARRNAARNGLDQAAFESGDVLKRLDRLRQEGKRFDVVICDPPKYAPTVKDMDAALRGYLRLNLAALSVLEEGGILATCSCSGLVDRRVFLELLGRVAEESRRPLQILEQRGQPPDHPISAACPQSDYLKCFICRVGG